MGKLEGKVAFITGAARGQGRAEAIRLAQEGADIIAVDICAQIPTAGYQMSSPEDLDETVRLVEAEDRRIFARQGDTRDIGRLREVVDAGVAELGRLDFAVANAGISSWGAAVEIEEDEWDDVVDTNLKGVWNTCKVAVPHIRAHGEGGALVLTSSAAGLHAYANLAHYASAKHGVVGLMRTLALELAPDLIRVNSIHPTQVDTDMIQNEPTWRLFRPDLEHPPGPTSSPPRRR
jgi:(+)-trans-carveol dehydrogenase